MKTNPTRGPLGHIDVKLLSSPVGSARDERKTREYVSQLLSYATYGKDRKRSRGTESAEVVISEIPHAIADKTVDVPATDPIRGHGRR